MAAVLIFDGDCSFCTSTANFLNKNAKKPIEIRAWQLTDLSLVGLTPEQASKRVYLVIGEEKFGGAKAVARALIRQRNFLLVGLGYLLLVPPFSWLAIPGYVLIAKYRHLLPGGTPACKL